MNEKIWQLIDKREDKKPSEYIDLPWLLINQAIQDLKSLKEQPTYEQWYERWKQVGYKEWWRARGEELTEDKLKTIDEVISYIWQNEWREDSEDYYREHFWLKLKYKKQ